MPKPSATPSKGICQNFWPQNLTEWDQLNVSVLLKLSPLRNGWQKLSPLITKPHPTWKELQRCYVRKGASNANALTMTHPCLRRQLPSALLKFPICPHRICTVVQVPTQPALLPLLLPPFTLLVVNIVHLLPLLKWAFSTSTRAVENAANFMFPTMGPIAQTTSRIELTMSLFWKTWLAR